MNHVRLCMKTQCTKLRPGVRRQHTSLAGVCKACDTSPKSQLLLALLPFLLKDPTGTSALTRGVLKSKKQRGKKPS